MQFGGKHNRKYNSILFLFIFISYGLLAQDNVQKVSIPRKLNIFFIISGDISKSESLLLQESLLIQLSDNPEIIILETFYSEIKSDTDMNDFVNQVGGDCWLKILISAENEKFIITVSSYDLFGKKFVIENKVIEKDRKIRGIAGGFWREIYTDIKENYTAIEEIQQVKETYTTKHIEEYVTVIKGVNLSIKGVPGTTITGFGPEPVRIGPEGILTIELNELSTYNITATHIGYYPFKKSIYLNNQDKSIKLEQIKGSILGVDIYLQNIDYIGLGFFYYFIPNSLFLNIQSTFYQKKLIWPVTTNRQRYDLPLTYLFATIGYYLLPEDSFIRLYLSAGVFIRLTELENIGFTIDPLSPWGLKLLSINAEFFTGYKLKPFFEYSWLLYFTDNSQMMKASLLDVDNASNMLAGYFFTDNSVFDMLYIQAGIRIQIP